MNNASYSERSNFNEAITIQVFFLMVFIWFGLYSAYGLKERGKEVNPEFFPLHLSLPKFGVLPELVNTDS